MVKLNTRTWARGVTTTYLYDAAGQTEGIDYSDSTPDVAMEYDHLGRLTTADNGISLNTYTYNPSDLTLTAETVTVEGASSLLTRTLTRHYDTLLRPTSCAPVAWNSKTAPPLRTPSATATTPPRSQMSRSQMSRSQMSDL